MKNLLHSIPLPTPELIMMLGFFYIMATAT